MKLDRIALGTVQFGMNYGISNSKGQVDITEVEKILNFCQENGINTLDTAQGYGNSESVLGAIGVKDFRIITKVAGTIDLEKSLENLKIDKLYAAMFHRDDEINEKNWEKLSEYKKNGNVEKVGVSVYYPDILLDLIEKYPIDIVQFPLNILDQRFVDILPKLKEKGVEIHTRSAFLQGLFFLDEIPEYFNPIIDILKAIPRPRIQHAINFCKGIKEVDKIVIGVTCLDDIIGIYDAYNVNIEKTDYSKFYVKDDNFINPSKWRL